MISRISFIALMIIFLFACQPQENDTYSLYKINVIVKPDSNLFRADLSLNYCADTLLDTVTFYLNRSLRINSLYGRHLAEYFFDTTSVENVPAFSNASKLTIVFIPPLKQMEWVRLNMDYSCNFDDIAYSPEGNSAVYEFKNAAAWYPVQANTEKFFYAININTSPEYEVSGNNEVHFIDNNWQTFSDNPTTDIFLKFQKK